MCGDCGGPLGGPAKTARSRAVHGKVLASATRPTRPESAALIPGTSIALGDRETVWREYPVTQLGSRERGLGTLYVTESRVISSREPAGAGLNELAL